jgi:hypothetical protein
VCEYSNSVGDSGNIVFKLLAENDFWGKFCGKNGIFGFLAIGVASPRFGVVGALLETRLELLGGMLEGGGFWRIFGVEVGRFLLGGDEVSARFIGIEIKSLGK